MKCEIREICGDWALDIMAGEKVTIYFNSRQNALNVKRILEVDDSIPNAATVCDMQEVVKCKDCKHSRTALADEFSRKGDNEIIHCINCKYLEISGCYGECGMARLGIVHPDDYCSRGERKE